jgi:hypothetical protein
MLLPARGAAFGARALKIISVIHALLHRHMRAAYPYENKDCKHRFNGGRLFSSAHVLTAAVLEAAQSALCEDGRSLSVHNHLRQCVTRRV